MDIETIEALLLSIKEQTEVRKANNKKFEVFLPKQEYDTPKSADNTNTGSIL